MKLAIWLDLPISLNGESAVPYAPYLLRFAERFSADFEEVRLCIPVDSRVTTSQLSQLQLPPNVRVVCFPHYVGLDGILNRLPSLIRAGLRIGSRQARECQLVGYNSPSLMGCIFATFALLKGVAQFELIRGDKLEVIRKAYRGPRLWISYSADWLFDAWMDIVRRCGRVVTFAQGTKLTSKYGRRNPGRAFRMLLLISREFVRSEDEISNQRAQSRAHRVVLYVGRLSPEKGVHVLLEAVGLLKDRHLDCALRVIGDGPHEADLRAKSEALGLGGCTTWVGRVDSADELKREYDNADVVAVPSFSEGVPAVIAEAMARGVPVVASDVGSVADIVQHDVTGLLVAPGEATDLGDALHKVLTNEDLAHRLATSARVKVAALTLDHQYQHVIEHLRLSLSLPPKVVKGTTVAAR